MYFYLDILPKSSINKEFERNLLDERAEEIKKLNMELVKLRNYNSELVSQNTVLFNKIKKIDKNAKEFEEVSSKLREKVEENKILERELAKNRLIDEELSELRTKHKNLIKEMRQSKTKSFRESQASPSVSPVKSPQKSTELDKIYQIFQIDPNSKRKINQIQAILTDFNETAEEKAGVEMELQAIYGMYGIDRESQDRMELLSKKYQNDKDVIQHLLNFLVMPKETTNCDQIKAQMDRLSSEIKRCELAKQSSKKELKDIYGLYDVAYDLPSRFKDLKQYKDETEDSFQKIADLVLKENDQGTLEDIVRNIEEYVDIGKKSKMDNDEIRDINNDLTKEIKKKKKTIKKNEEEINELSPYKEKFEILSKLINTDEKVESDDEIIGKIIELKTQLSSMTQEYDSMSNENEEIRKEFEEIQSILGIEGLTNEEVTEEVQKLVSNGSNNNTKDRSKYVKKVNLIPIYNILGLSKDDNDVENLIKIKTFLKESKKKSEKLEDLLKEQNLIKQETDALCEALNVAKFEKPVDCVLYLQNDYQSAKESKKEELTSESDDIGEDVRKRHELFIELRQFRDNLADIKDVADDLEDSPEDLMDNVKKLKKLANKMSSNTKKLQSNCEKIENMPKNLSTEELNKVLVVANNELQTENSKLLEARILHDEQLSQVLQYLNLPEDTNTIDLLDKISSLQDSEKDVEAIAYYNTELDTKYNELQQQFLCLKKIYSSLKQTLEYKVDKRIIDQIENLNKQEKESILGAYLAITNINSKSTF